MNRLVKWAMLLAGASVVFGVNCGFVVRDAVLSGAIDYVSGTTTSALDSVFPISEIIAAAMGR